MSHLLRLYPPRWRTRYEAELRDALAARPVTSRDRIGLVRGALDAWAHPELAPPSDLEPVPVGAPTQPTVRPQRRVRGSGYAALSASILLGLSAFVLLQRDGAMNDALILQGLLPAVGTLLLGIAVGLAPDRGRLVRAGASILVTGALLGIAAAAEGWWVLAMLPLGIGGGVVALGLVAARPGRPALGLAWLIALGILAVGARERDPLLLSVGLAVPALLAVPLALPGGAWRPTRGRAIGAAVAMAVTIAIAWGASPWRQHGDFALACAGTSTACERVYGDAVRDLRGRLPGVDIRSVSVDARGRLSLCWRHPDEMGGAACWSTDRWARLFSIPDAGA